MAIFTLLGKSPTSRALRLGANIEGLEEIKRRLVPDRTDPSLPLRTEPQRDLCILDRPTNPETLGLLLHSLALKDDPALQACLHKDQAHLTLGTKGKHVGKVQKALMLLDKAQIRLAELQMQVYGPSTAAAVLAFKQKRKIINFSYQKSADNIVGKMTIARLDDEMFELERQNTPNRAVCETSVNGGGAQPSIFSVGDRKPQLAKAQNAVLRVIFQETSGAEKIGGGFSLALDLFTRAKELLAPHAMRFSDGMLLDFVGPRVPDFENVLPGSPASCFSVRESAERVMPGQTDSLRVIFCPFDEKGQANGVTDGGQLGTSNFPKFCLINVRNKNPDHGTLLHEMIHATRKESIAHDTDARSVFSEGTSRSVLLDKHAESLADAFFATRRL